ncbi:hypothetical protein MNBD_NITROSPINAE04-340 [hydrothermal vent metagenome]|uniref:DUF429 domain-containing protein n=1 Tax=hydrothermal vent metagenome TaxID=652676 RepID=A0A3B1BT87_9ZZZZ
MAWVGGVDGCKCGWFAVFKNVKRSGFSRIEEAVDAFLRKKVAVAKDDILDAYAALWSAERIYLKKAIRIPEKPPKDEKGLCMEIWR